MEKVIAQYRNRIYGFLLKYVKVPQQAEDMTQDILIKLWINQEKIRLYSFEAPRSDSKYPRMILKSLSCSIENLF